MKMAFYAIWPYPQSTHTVGNIPSPPQSASGLKLRFPVVYSSCRYYHVEKICRISRYTAKNSPEYRYRSKKRNTAKNKNFEVLLVFINVVKRNFENMKNFRFVWKIKENWYLYWHLDISPPRKKITKKNELYIRSETPKTKIRVFSPSLSKEKNAISRNSVKPTLIPTDTFLFCSRI